MIQNTDIRLGNYVFHKDEGILEIAKIKHRSATVFNSERKFRHFKYEDIDGIELTPELLILCGFEKDPIEDFGYITPFQRTRLLVCFHDNGPGITNTYWIEDVGEGRTLSTNDIKHFHTLQNINRFLLHKELQFTTPLFT